MGIFTYFSSKTKNNPIYIKLVDGSVLHEDTFKRMVNFHERHFSTSDNFAQEWKNYRIIKLPIYGKG